MPFATFLLAAMLMQPAGVTSQAQGTISDSDPVAAGTHYDAWPVELQGGHRVTVSVTPRGSSAAFDVGVHDQGSGRTLAGGGAAQVGFTPPASGLYMVRVSSAGEGGYTLRIAEVASGGGGEVDSAGPPARFILCPGHQRCPR